MVNAYTKCHYSKISIRNRYTLDSQCSSKLWPLQLRVDHSYIYLPCLLIFHSSAIPPVQGTWLLHTLIQSAMKTYSLVLCFKDIARLYGLARSLFGVHSVSIARLSLCTPGCILIAKPSREKFAVFVGLIYYIKASHKVMVIVRKGRLVRFVRKASFLCWRDKMKNRQTVVTIPDNTSITVNIKVCSHVIS